jgi:hypothetical protein
VLLQDFITFERLAVALVNLWTTRMGLSQGENLFFGEALHHQIHLSTSVDAAAHVPLQLHLGGEQFLAHLALVSGVIWFPVVSETGNWISVKKSLQASIMRFLPF